MAPRPGRQSQHLGGSYIQYRELFDGSATVGDVIALVRELNKQEALLHITGMTAHLRWALDEPDREHLSRVHETLVATVFI